jgi:hypothetical protein
MKTDDQKARECVEAFKPAADAAQAVLDKIKPDDGGPAFPRDEMSNVVPNQIAEQFPGMSLRAYIATAAMQGCLAYSHVNPNCGNYQENATAEDVAKAAVAYADALIAALK